MRNPSKSDGVSLVTEQDEKPFEKAEFVKETARSLTTLDIIGLAVLTVFQPALFRGQLIGGDSPREKQGEGQEILDNDN